MEIQTWYVAIDINNELVAMFLLEADCMGYCKAKEEITGLPYTQDVYKMQLKR